VAEGAGRFALATGDVWPDHPEKVLAFAEGLAERRPDVVLAATAAVIGAQRWLVDPANRPAAVALLAERVLPQVGPGTIAAALDGCVAAPPGGTPWPLTAPLTFDPDRPPSPAAAERWCAAMHRWGHLPEGAAADAAVASWRPDLWRRAADRLAGSVPTQAPQESLP
jgi:ABC-type nitrate/sulfonate/bicarbonate transport system substrate-binding protein